MLLVTILATLWLGAEGSRGLQVGAHRPLAHVPVPALLAHNLPIHGAEVSLLGLNSPL